MTVIFDGKQRQLALDVTQSFIVQAPAGSGKTQLLTQRFLALLATVQQPEEVLALTFTRKAASEMRHRIVSTLQDAVQKPCPSTPHEQHSWQLAKAVLLRDEQHDWQLLNNPHRLKVQTMDALCARLSQAMPILAQMGGQPDIVEDPTLLYSEACENLLSYLEDAALSEPLSILLQHCDNQLQRVKDLLMALLATREQWLSIVLIKQDAIRETLEQHWQSVVEHALVRAESQLVLLDELMPFVDFAKQYLPPDHPLQILSADILPSVSEADLPKWRALINWLLTAEDQQWRKQVTIKQGFPAPSSSKNPDERDQYQWMKQQFLLHIDELKQNPTLLSTLHQVLRLPTTTYADGQWHVLSALMTLLPLLVAELMLCFKKTASIDFIAMAQAAFYALGSDAAPTDLALSLDYRLQHILVDEFQDTSISQIRLLERLIAGWQTGDGRTLFLVGDPMQSIYRFRQAEVGLFLQVQQQGLAGVSLTSLQLTCNFRSTSEIVDWVNETFQSIMPAQDNIEEGAICYAPSMALRTDPNNSQVRWHLLTKEQSVADAMLQQIKRIRQQSPTDSIAILVRARSQAKEIVAALQAASIDYQAVDIQTLANTPVINDLLALTTALLHLSDRTAWLSLLRSPLVGLSLSELAILVEDEPHTLIWERLQHAMASNVAPWHVQRVYGILSQCIEQRQRWALRQWLEDAWHALGGPAIYDETQVSAAKTYFDLLAMEQEELCIHRLQQRLQKLYAKTNAITDNPVQIMTIHKSKGLEFDVVMVPGLEQRSAITTRALLDWVDVTTDVGVASLIAPIKAYDSDAEPMSDFIRYQQQIKEQHELTRVLYVAATRAKKQLYWFANLAMNDDGERLTPPRGSLLEKLWPFVCELPFTDTTDTIIKPKESNSHANLLQRLPMDWQLPSDIQWSLTATLGTLETQNQFTWQPNVARVIGIVMHRCLQAFGQAGGCYDISAQQLQRLLQFHGCIPSQVSQAVTQLQQALKKVAQDPIGQWILRAHQAAAVEYALAGVIQQKTISGVLDRTFIDEQGVRWIIDYKMVDELPADLDDFLDRQQQQYALQLERYAALMALTEVRVIKLGLYFPRIPAWRTWEF